MIIALALLSAIGSPAAAATAVGTFSASLVIRSTCDIASTDARDFRIAVQCTHPTPYHVGLDKNSLGTALSARATTSGIAAGSSKLPADATASVRTDTATDAGSGDVPEQPLAPLATQGDTVTVTITY